MVNIKEKVLTPIAKTVLLPSGETEAASATNVAIQKNVWIRHDYTHSLKQRNGRYDGNN